MKKQLILVGGAMGVGKSAVCRELLRQLTPGVWLDGDWCWNMNPFVVSEENKRMVLSNITHLLRAYLNNSSYHRLHVALVHIHGRLYGNGWNAMYGTASGRLTSSREASGGCLPAPHCRHANWM